MSTKLNIPNRTEQIIQPNRTPTRRFHDLLNSIPKIADDQIPLTITWTANAPTPGTTQTIADGGSPTVAETGQAIQNINTILTGLITELKTAGVIKT
jgi:hypothetical protein